MRDMHGNWFADRQDMQIHQNHYGTGGTPGETMISPRDGLTYSKHRMQILVDGLGFCPMTDAELASHQAQQATARAHFRAVWGHDPLG